MEKDLLVKVLAAIIENDYKWLFVNKDLSIEGECNYGFITEDAIHSVLLDTDMDEYKRKFNIPKEAKIVKLELGYINDIQIHYYKDDFDEEVMERLTDDIWAILGNKFDLMTVEAHPIEEEV